MNFKQFLLIEDTRDLANRVGDIYSALQSLEKTPLKKIDASIVATKDIVSQIRKIVRTIDSKEHKEYLEKLSSIGVMLMKSIDGTNEISLEDSLKKATLGTRALIDKLGSPINDLGTDAASKNTDDSAVSDSIKKPTKAVVPPSDQKVTQPTSPGGPPQQEVPTLGGSTGDLKNL